MGPFIADRGRGNFAHYKLSLVVGKKKQHTKEKTLDHDVFEMPLTNI